MGTIITEKRAPHKNQINLKTAGIVHIVNSARILAVNSGISEPSTFRRLDQLTQAGLIPEEDAEFFRTSFETLMMFKIRENMKKVKQGKTADNYIDPSEFRRSEIRLLKDALSGVSQLQKLVNKKFNVMWLKYFGQ
jgi:CBS domain-containing protein